MATKKFQLSQCDELHSRIEEMQKRNQKGDKLSQVCEALHKQMVEIESDIKEADESNLESMDQNEAWIKRVGGKILQLENIVKKTSACKKSYCSEANTTIKMTREKSENESSYCGFFTCFTD